MTRGQLRIKLRESLEMAVEDEAGIITVSKSVARIGLVKTENPNLCVCVCVCNGEL
jgi:hypothetical protein